MNPILFMVGGWPVHITDVVVAFAAAGVLLLLVITIGLLSALWTGALTSGVWTIGALVIHLVIIRACRRFLDEPAATMNLRAWRLRFILLDLFFGMAWTFILVQPLGGESFGLPRH